MLIFKKTNEETGNKFVGFVGPGSFYRAAPIDIELKLPNDSTLEDILDCTKKFVQACGFGINTNEEIVLYTQEDENNTPLVSIDVDMTDETFKKIATMAYEKDITFNEMCIQLLKEHIDQTESKADDMHITGELIGAGHLGKNC